MVERLPDDLDLDAIFQALAHPIRRDILEQLADGPKSVGELAEPHDVSLAAVSKHLHVLEDAGLLDVEEDGRVRRCHLDAAPLGAAFGWLTRYRVFWEDRLDALADHLEDEDQ
ncbi:ArsR family transcriptional regulator (plasmid) [Haloferax mediterranei ATCC 33500]|nr:metalloregulator ArsR/SmtB family transcription factor [Haloferax mediterranei]AFK21037.1 putative transcriptional regulator, ArsR family protein [Haloferax mediterranei ATCC 33500]AHZ24102.1 ArsR family transcriptional regulator [Haloferax mediterranei ATCC 33500]MDX5989748.1 metalloregulator ArsR/SmtB family transcription factor [Haloferax mediterranei ATCC 33500]QCQ77198.1 ArsR family transcriptional regulator [Haloferax mediterranei ATCC 33500]